MLGITETKKKGQGVLKLTNNNILIYSGVSHETSAAAGVGCLINEILADYILAWKVLSENILTVEIKDGKTNQIKSIVVVYGPNEDDMMNNGSNCSSSHPVAIVLNVCPVSRNLKRIIN